MPAWIVVAIPSVLAALAATIAGALLVGPFVLPLYFKRLTLADLERIRPVAKGAFFVAADIVRKTPIAADDDLPKVLQMVVDIVEKEIGVRLKPHEERAVKGIAMAMHLDPSLPSLTR